MGFFSGIVDSIKETFSTITDIAINFVGNVTDNFKPHEIPTERPYRGTGEDPFDYEYGYDDGIYDDYIDWIRDTWY